MTNVVQKNANRQSAKNSQPFRLCLYKSSPSPAIASQTGVRIVITMYFTLKTRPTAEPPRFPPAISTTSALDVAMKQPLLKPNSRFWARY